MNKAALWLGAAGVVAGMVIARPSSAAEMFADVPTDHWAYQAVNNLQERGIVIGYPDGTFGGKRAMTRYEFAVAIDRLVDWVTKSIAQIDVKTGGNGLTEDQIRSIIDEKTGNFATKDDLSNLATKDDLKNLPSKEDLETIQRLANEFKDELAALGTNVDTIRRDVDSLKTRVSAIEERLDKWKITGETNFIARGERASNATIPTYGNAKRSVLDLDSRSDNNNTSNLLQDMKALYNIDLGVTYNVGGGATANAVFDYGNYLNWADNNRLNPGLSYSGTNGYVTDNSRVQGINGNKITQGNHGGQSANADMAFTPVKLFYNTPVQDLWFLKKIDATVGKFGVKFTPYTLESVDPDSYTSVSLTDNGEVTTTGVKANANIGNLQLQGYAGVHNSVSSNSNSIGDAVYVTWGGPAALSLSTYGGYPFDQSTGVHGLYQLGRFTLGGTYILAGITPDLAAGDASLPQYSDTNTYASRVNTNNDNQFMVPRRAQVAGGELRFPLFGGLAFSGEYSNSDVMAGTQYGKYKSVYTDGLREAYDGKLTWQKGKLDIAAGYKQVDPNFGAPGNWGNIGLWKNPTNIEGFDGKVGLNFGGFTLNGTYEDYKSVRIDNSTARAGYTIIDDKNKLQHYTVGLKFNLNPTSDIDFGWEQARIRPFNVLPAYGDGKTKENYWDIGIGHRFSDSTSLKVMYQIVDYKDNGAGLYTAPGGEYKGGIGVTQLSVRF